MSWPIERFSDLMALEPHGPDAYVGVGPDYPWGRVYGGQVVAQGLRAAASTVDADFGVHSVHAYFIRGGDFDEPIRYEVDRIRNGRSFVTRRVVARQSNGAILNLAASFQRGEDEADVQIEQLPADLGGPDDLDDDRDDDGGMWTTVFARRSGFADAAARAGRSSAWMRILEDLDDDPVTHACALAYLSDDLPTDAVYGTHPDHAPGNWERLVGASLDHAIWFHRHARADRWQAHDYRGHGLRGGRGLSIGQVYTVDGSHVATVAQEVLVRRNRDA